MSDSKKELSDKVKQLVLAKIKSLVRLMAGLIFALVVLFSMQYVIFRNMIKDNITPIEQRQAELREKCKELSGEFTGFKGDFVEFKTEIKTRLKNLETKIDKKDK